MKSIAYAVAFAASLGVAAFAPDWIFSFAGSVWCCICGVFLLMRDEK